MQAKLRSVVKYVCICDVADLGYLNMKPVAGRPVPPSLVGRPVAKSYTEWYHQLPFCTSFNRTCFVANQPTDGHSQPTTYSGDRWVREWVLACIKFCASSANAAASGCKVWIPMLYSAASAASSSTFSALNKESDLGSLSLSSSSSSSSTRACEPCSWWEACQGLDPIRILKRMAGISRG